MRAFLGRLLLRHPRAFARVGELPVLGPCARWLGRRMLPIGTHVWSRIERGPAAGLWLRIDPRFGHQYIAAPYEPLLQDLLLRHLAPGSVFYDVGAHLGVFSLLAARRVGDTGRVFSFEADPANAARIEENARRNALHRVTVVPVAAWKECGRLRFERGSDRSSRNTGRVSDAVRVAPETIEVEAVTLDSFAEKNPPPQIIKIDVEGAETEVLRGAEGMFTETRPTLICELHNPPAAAEVQSWLAEKGYQWDWLTDSRDYPRHIFALPRP